MNNELLFLLSLGLKKLLKNIYDNYNDPISYNLLKSHKNILSPISFLDRSKDIDKITYTTFKNVLPFIEEKDYDPNSEDIYKLKKAWLDKYTKYDDIQEIDLSDMLG